MNYFGDDHPRGFTGFIHAVIPGLALVLVVGVFLAFVDYAIDQNPDSGAQTASQTASQAGKPEVTITTDGEPQAIGTDYERSVVMVTLEDGTRCAVLEGLKVGSIDCDWNNTPAN